MTPEQTLDWLAEQHKSQCNEDRPVQEWIRSMKSMLPAPVQEPVAFFDWYDNAHWGNEDFKEGCHRSWNAAIKYTTPPAAQRQWVGLTDDEIFSVLGNLQKKYNGPPTEDSRVVFALAIETKLKEKNNV